MAIVGLALALPATADAQRRCTRGKPCGNTCINVNYTCRVGTTPPPPPPAAEPPATQPRGLVGQSQGQPTSQTYSPPGVVYSGNLSHCTTGLASIRELLIVGDVRSGGTIGRDLMVGTAFDAPGRGDTIPAELLAIRCPEPDQVTLYVQSRGRLVALDNRSIPLRSAAGASTLTGNVRVRSAGRAVPAFVWVDAFGVATLRADQ